MPDSLKTELIVIGLLTSGCLAITLILNILKLYAMISFWRDNFKCLMVITRRERFIISKDLFDAACNFEVSAANVDGDIELQMHQLKT